MELIIYLAAIFPILFFIIGVTCSLYELSTRKDRFENKIKELKESGCRIKYQNQSTGTISYIKEGASHQVSVYRGYNSHAKRY